MTEGKRNLIQGLLQEYDIKTAEDIQDTLKDLLSGTGKEMLEAEMDDHCILLLPTSSFVEQNGRNALSTAIADWAQQINSLI